MEELQQWYAVYTKPRSEKKLADRLIEQGIEAYLPMRRTLKQWSDRKKMVSEPLISSYVFVHIFQKDYFNVLNTPGAVRYIWFCGKPAIIPSNQIESLKLIMSQDIEVDLISSPLPQGTRVKVVSGIFKELTGELLNYAGKHKVMIRLEQLDKAVLLTISPKLLEEVPHPRPLPQEGGERSEEKEWRMENGGMQE
jgi:transcription antitermination factor NusG